MSIDLTSRIAGFSITRRNAIRAGVAAGAASLTAMPLLSRAVAQEGDYPEVRIIGTDHAFEMEDSFPGGLVRMVFENQGEDDHHVWIIHPNEDSSVEEIMGFLMTEDVNGVLASSTSYGGPIAGPGGTAVTILDLPQGNYVVICVIPDAEGVPHLAHGMMKEFEVTHPATTLAAPEADMTIELMEMMFHGVEGPASAGAQIWDVVNAGEQLHELALLQLAPGITADMFMEMMAAEPDPDAEAPEGPPPFSVVNGAGPMSPGTNSMLELDLEAGEYVALCFMPDPETGLPHVALGMALPITVE